MDIKRGAVHVVVLHTPKLIPIIIQTEAELLRAGKKLPELDKELTQVISKCVGVLQESDSDFPYNPNKSNH